MKMRILYNVLIFVMVISFVAAFTLVEWIPIKENYRQEARIDNIWLITENTSSYAKGYLIYDSNSSDGGYIKNYYYGIGTDGINHSVYGIIDISNVYISTYGKHFEGYTIKNIVDGMEIDKSLVSGFFCDVYPCYGEFYIRYDNPKYGMTWAVFT